VNSIQSVIDYDQLLQLQKPTMQRMVEQLDLPFDRTRMTTFEMEFLNIKLSHSAHNLKELIDDKSCPSLVQKIYENLLQLSDGKLRSDDSGWQSRISFWSAELERLQPIMQHADILLRKIEAEAAPKIPQSLYNVLRTIFRKLPFSG
jgi:hypothetical protein